MLSRQETKGLRARFLKIVECAADAGISGAAGLLDRTPAEIELELRAAAARQMREMEQLDALAWLTGRYAAIGWHAPRKYPKRPEGVRRTAPAMSDQAMKDVFLGMARRGKEK